MRLSSFCFFLLIFAIPTKSDSEHAISFICRAKSSNCEQMRKCCNSWPNFSCNREFNQNSAECSTEMKKENWKCNCGTRPGHTGTRPGPVFNSSLMDSANGTFRWAVAVTMGSFILITLIVSGTIFGIFYFMKKMQSQKGVVLVQPPAWYPSAEFYAPRTYEAA